MDKMEVSKKIAELRAKRGLTAKEVGDKMDVSLRETGIGGVAGTPAAQEVVERLGM